MASTAIQSRQYSTPSQIPEHLRPFHRPLYTSLPVDLTRKSSRTVSFADSPPSSTRRVASSISHSSSARRVSLPGPHSLPARKVSFATTHSSPDRISSASEHRPLQSRLVSKRTRREIFKDVLLKDWLGTNRCIPGSGPAYCRASSRSVSDPDSRVKGSSMPAARMKDSDDYLTARAANPRTGMISPSVGTRTPGVSSTPSSPGEALQRSSVEFGDNVAVAAQRRFRPPLVRRANEGRKVSSGVLRRKPVAAEAGGQGADGGVVGLGMGDKVLLAWPELAGVPADASIAIIPGAFPSASLPPSGAAPTALNADALVRMPSAQEPQPYAYPGCSPQQIEALRLHGQSWRRKDSAVGVAMDDTVGDRAFEAATAATVICGAVEEIHVPKRRKPIQLHIAEMHAATRSPGNAGLNPEQDGQRFVSATIEDETNEPRDFQYHPNAARPVPYPTSTPQLNNPTPIELSSLPRLTFVHPRHAAIPQLTHLRIRTEPDLERERFLATQRTRRDRSLNCPLDPRTDICATAKEMARAASNNTVIFTEPSSQTPRPLFEDLHARQEEVKASNSNEAFLTTPAISIPLTPLAEILLTTLLTFASALLALPLPAFPQPAALKTLYSDHTRPAEKVAALKSLVAGAGQVVVLLSVLAALWQVLTLLGRVVEFIVWPFLVPFRILRWVGG